MAVCNEATLHGQPLSICGHLDGPVREDGADQQALLETLWRGAGNDVQWQGSQRMGGSPAAGW